MKKILHFLVVSTLGIQLAFAGGATGGATEVTQLLNNAELIPINISDALTALATEADMIKNTIGDPIMGAIISTAVQTTSNSMLSWINGGLEGNSLIQSPEDFIDRKKFDEVRKILSAIPENSAFGDSLFSSILESENEESLEEIFESFSTSQIPSIVQNNLCNDARLTEEATRRVMDEEGNYDQESVNNEKEYLYDYACSGDPVGDDDLSVKLIDLYTQDPSLGGDDAWLYLTGGGNEFTQSALGLSAAKEKVENKKELAMKELFDGLGTVSQTECLEEGTDFAGIGVCLQEAILNPGEAVQETLNTVANSGLLRLISADPDGFASILTSFMTEMLGKGLNTAVSEMTGGNEGEEVVVITPPVDDLANDPERKEEFVNSIEKRLEFDEKTLDDLEQTDNTYTAAINSYEAQINQVKDCFDSLIARGITTRGNNRVNSAYAYYNDRKSRIDAARSVIQNDRLGIAAARALIAATRSQLEATNSSQEIAEILGDYTGTYERQNFPDSSDLSQRRQSYTRDSGDASRDTEKTSHLNACQSIEDDYYRAQQTY